MAPSPQETMPPTPSPRSGDVLTGEEVVISGISGLFPSSDNVQEFMDNLYNKVDMITEKDTTFEHADLPNFSGKITGIHKFDAQFFRVTKKQADSMEPMCRKLMEQAYCAMYDAGVNPLLYKGKKIGVFTTEMNGQGSKLIGTNDQGNPFLISGACPAMLANRISYWLDAKGPSYNVEHWSGSAICLQNAINHIRTGICDAAIVGGAELGADPVLAVNMRNAGLLCMNGKTRCFDKDGDGYVQSQAMGVLFLQKAKDAKRIYAEVHKVGIEYGCKQGEVIDQKRETKQILDFLNNFYSGADVSPNDVEYVEAHGAAIPQADANELQAIGQIFGKEKPVMVGCVKSNMGCSESVSGICAVTKLCLAYHKGKLAGNLHYNNPLDIDAIKEGRIDVLTDNAPFNRGYTALNNFSYVGTNCHIVLKGHFKPKNPDRYKCDIPRLVLISARHEKGIGKIFEILKDQPMDPELLGMLDDIYQVETPGFTCRGYTILDTKNEQTVSLDDSTALYQGAPRPLWLVFSGMGSQWAGMGTELMRIPIFAAAIEKCCKTLEPKGVDVVRIITSPDKTIFDSVLNAFIGIAAVQIGLIDILKEMGVVPDHIIGHSLGEMGCAYYDGCFSAEEMILVAYARGLVSIKTKLIKGSMAAVGLGYENMLELCPPEIDIACHNSAEFCTISGPADVMKTFVAELAEKGVFAKEVPTGNIAYHSRYIQDAGPGFLKLLKEIIKTPAKRSDKWITTSWPEEKWGEPAAQLSSAEYHANNLLSPVYFEETARLMPSNAVVVEVAPHGLMQAILKKSHPECTHIPLTRRGHSNALEFLFGAFGKLYKEGYNLKVNILYPKIEYPVSTKTPLLSHFIEWYHEEDWTVRTYSIIKSDDKCTMSSRTLVISTQDEDYKFLLGHTREGNIVFPEAAILFYVWETLAMYNEVDHKEMSVTFCDVNFLTEVVIDAEETIKLKFAINKGNNHFEVTRDDVMVTYGNIIIIPTTTDSKISEKMDTDNQYCGNFLTSDDVYKLMNLKGHFYQNDFRTIQSFSPQWNYSQIKMSGNWITFIDSLIQLNILARNYNGVSVPKIINSLTINMPDHKNLSDVKILNDGQNIFSAQYSKINGVTNCGGITLSQIFFNDKLIEESEPDVLRILSLHPKDFGQLEGDSFIQNSKINKIKEYKLVNTKRGTIDSLKWAEVEADNSNVVKVCYAGPSMRDAQNVVGLGEIKKDFGMDFSGFDDKGNRVMGLVVGGALASTVKPDQDFLWPVPEHWTLAEAATVPLPYVHAFYCLCIRGRVQAGQSVFVTGGAGALGQAIISICLSLGCDVYTSVGDLQKKRFLMSLFSDLTEDNIGYSHDVHFHSIVLSNTNKRRCDFVISCDTGHSRELAMKCVGVGGYFLDTSEFDMKQNINLGMFYLDEYKGYITVNLSGVFRPENIDDRKLLHKALSEGIVSGIVRPISYVVYPPEKAERAFRLLSLRRHIGRALIQMRQSDTSTTILSGTQRITYPSEEAFLVVCGDEVELGVHLINHLVERGARKFIFHQHAKETRFVEAQLLLWQNMGATVKISTKDLQIRTTCVDILKTEEMLKGIFIIQPKRNGSEYSKEDFIENANSITSVVQNLDHASRHHCPELKYFVMLASTSEHDINKRVTSVVEQICEMRTEIGFPALILRAELLNKGEHLDGNRSEIRPMTVQSTLKAMDISLKQNYASVLAYNKKKDTCEFLDKIANILGIENINAVDENLYIKHLIFNEIIFEEIKTIIKENYKLELPTKFIGEMTIYSLINFSKLCTKLSSNFDSNLAAFYNFVDYDIIRATEIFVPMHTARSLVEEEHNLHGKTANLMIVPGFEGHHHTFKSMCERLKIRATTLQLGPDLSNESIQKIAFDLKEPIKQRFILKPQFYLLGHSFGINVALEIAALLEKDGFIGVVYCLDSSPDALRVQLDAYLGEMSEEQLQNAIIKHMFYVMSGQNSKILDQDIENLKDWTEKVDRCVEELKDLVKYSNEYKKAQIESFYKRLNLVKSYNPEFKLASNIVLLKGVSHPKAEHLPADYGLSKYSKNPIKVFDINSDVASAPYDSRVPNFINQLLDSSLLDDYQVQNHCECYSISQNISLMMY